MLMCHCHCCCCCSSPHVRSCGVAVLCCHFVIPPFVGGPFFSNATFSLSCFIHCLVRIIAEKAVHKPPRQLYIVTLYPLYITPRTHPLYISSTLYIRHHATANGALFT